MMLAAAALVVLVMIASWAPPALAADGTLIDLGTGVTPIAVSDSGQVLLSDGTLWLDGSEVTAQAPASAPTDSFSEPQYAAESMLNDAGLVVGQAGGTPAGGMPAYWDSTQSQSFTEISLAGLSVNGAPATGGYLDGVDAAGEAVGAVWNSSGGPSDTTADTAGLYVSAANGVPAGAPEVIASVDGQAIHSLEGISAGYEAANAEQRDSIGEVLIDRETQTATQTDVMGSEGAPIGFADNGTLAGLAEVAPGQFSEVERTADAAETELNWPVGESGPVTGVNGSNTAVGYVVNEIGTPAVWTGLVWSADGSSAPLLAEVADPGDWAQLKPTALDDAGDVVGTGLLGSATHGFLIQMGSTSSTSVACVVSAATSSGAVTSLKCTATVVPATPEEATAAPTGSVDFSATAGSFSDESSCTLTPTAGLLTSACSVTYTPAAGGSGASGPTITADYAGDVNYGGSTGTFVLCSDGGVVELDSISASGPHPNGFQTGNDVTLHGCGFLAGMTVQWGNTDATETLAAGDITTGGTLATIPVPWAATTGDVTVTDDAGDGATLSDQQVDSYRNTDGFGFHNYEDTNSAGALIAAFPAGTFSSTLSYGMPLLLGSSRTFYQIKSLHRDDGRCYGIAWLSASLADGSSQLSALGDVSTPWQLSLNGAAQKAADSDWWKQYSDQQLAYAAAVVAPAAGTGGSGIHAALTLAFGSDGFTHPALISIEAYSYAKKEWLGHEVVAFGVRDTPTDTDPGAFTIYTYNSNDEFLPAEDSDETLHAQEQTWSNIVVDSNGTWTDPSEHWTGSYEQIWVTPIAALEGPLTVTLPGASTSRSNIGKRAHASVGKVSGDVVADIGSTTDVVSASDPASGQPSDLTSDPVGLTVIAAQDALPRAVAATSGPGVGGIDELVGATGSWKDTLAASGGPLLAMWQMPGGDTASISANTGADGVELTGKDDTVSIGEPSKGRASKDASVTVTHGTNTQQIVTVTGALAAAGVKVSLTGHTAVVTAAHATKLDIQLASADSAGGSTYDLGHITIGKNTTLKVTASRWSGAQLGAVSATKATGHGPARRLGIRNHYSSPAATVTGGSLHGGRLIVKLRIPASLSGGVVGVSIVVRKGHRVLLKRSSGIAVTGAARRTLAYTLKPRTPVRITATVRVTSSSGGTTPGSTTHTTTIR